MTDDATTLAQMKHSVAAFIREREWEKYHQPKNLAMSIAIEAAELMEVFQWAEPDEVARLLADEKVRRQVSDELADILAFLLAFSNATGIDLAAGFRDKMDRNAKKYPADEYRGRYQRPNRGG